MTRPVVDTTTPTTPTTPTATYRRPSYPVARPNTAETKPAYKTTEFVVYLVAVIGVLLASFLVGDTADGRGDVFLADKAWFYVTLLTVGYMISRGLAKAGSRARDHA